MFSVSFAIGGLLRRFSKSMSKPVVIFVLGGPGAGKGTQCEKIVEVRRHEIHPPSVRQIGYYILDNYRLNCDYEEK